MSEQISERDRQTLRKEGRERDVQEGEREGKVVVKSLSHFLDDTHKYFKPFEKSFEPTVGLKSERNLVKKLRGKNFKTMFAKGISETKKNNSF